MKQLNPRFIFWGVVVAITIVFIVVYMLLFPKSKNIDASNESAQNTPAGTVAVPENTSIAPDNSLSSPVPVPVFMYHYIRDFNDTSDQIGTNLSVSPATFTSQILKFKTLDYQAISFNQYLSGKAGAKSIILTFDDGYDDAYEAYKILKQNNHIGIFYIVTAKIDTPGYLATAQIKEMSANGMIIGSHTISHPDLSTISNEKARTEILKSKTRLENITGNPIVDFCYPSGKYSDQTIELLKEAGYKTAVTTVGPKKNNFTDFFLLPRFRVNPTNTPNGLINQINSL